MLIPDYWEPHQLIPPYLGPNKFKIVKFLV